MDLDYRLEGVKTTKFLDSGYTWRCKTSWMQIDFCANENDEIVRYKTWLLAQEFSQRSNINFGYRYSPIVDVRLNQSNYTWKTQFTSNECCYNLFVLVYW